MHAAPALPSMPLGNAKREGLTQPLLRCAQYEFYNVLELIKSGHPDPTRKVCSTVCTLHADSVSHAAPVQAGGGTGHIQA